MVENESIVIINDTGLNVEYTINIDGNKTKVVSNDRKSIYPILQTDKDIFVKIRKEDIWQEKHWTRLLHRAVRQYITHGTDDILALLLSLYQPRIFPGLDIRFRRLRNLRDP